MISYLPKGLEWEGNDAHSAEGRYHVQVTGSIDPIISLSIFRGSERSHLGGWYESLDAAKAAAEAHHLEEWLKTAKPVEWISVKDRLPEKFGRYLVFNECVYIASFDGKGWRTEEPTHWLPLPSEPVEGKS